MARPRGTNSPRIFGRQAVVVSNGSYKECKGAAGWVIEVANNSGRIIGSTIVSDMHIDTHLKI